MAAVTGPYIVKAGRGERMLEIGAIAVVLVALGLLVALLFFGGGEGHEMAASGHTSAERDHASTGDRGEGHAAPAFLRSFASTGLALTVSYLAALCVWAGLRRKWPFLVRHLAFAAAMLLLVVLYLYARGGLGYNAHNWNRSFADASVILYAATLAIGPLARLWRPAGQALAWRRESGIWATVAAAFHVGIFWEERYGWSGWRAFFYPSGGAGEVSPTLMGDPSAGFVPTPFLVANVVGLVALAYALLLTATSNDASQRWLRSGWTWLMKRATTMQALVLLHTWLFAYYVTHENALAIGTLWIAFWAVLLLQTAAFGKTVWRRRAQPAPSTA